MTLCFDSKLLRFGPSYRSAILRRFRSQVGVLNSVCLVFFSFLFVVSGAKSFGKTYTTSFPLTELPNSENGNWTNGKANGLDWADVQTFGGIACGTQSGSAGFDDSTAILTGTWGPDQSAQATVYSTNQLGGNIYEEVELRLRSTISVNRNTGYEITFRCSSTSS